MNLVKMQHWSVFQMTVLIKIFGFTQPRICTIWIQVKKKEIFGSLMLRKED